MRTKIINAVFILIMSCTALGQSIDVGIDFRATSGFVTDGSTNKVDVTTAVTNYPVTETINGVSVTHGWETDGSQFTRDRFVQDPRLSGFGAIANVGTKQTYRQDVVSGTQYTISLAMGEHDNPQTQYVQLQDGTTPFATCTAVVTAANSFMDATCTSLTAANWISSNGTITHTFTTTIFRIVIGQAGVNGDSSTLAHYHLLSIDASGTGGAALLGNAVLKGTAVMK